MPNMTRLGLEYPAKDQRPWFDIFERWVSGLDASIYAHREDRNLIVEGGGTVSWNAPALSWTGSIYLVSPYTGYAMEIPVAQSPIDIADGQALYINMVRSLSGNTVVTAVVTSVLPSSNNAYMIAIRRGDTLYFRNGTGFDDGQSGPLYGPPLLVERVFLPICDAADQTPGPAPVSSLESPGGGGLRIRDFDGVASEVVCASIIVPPDIVVSAGLRARVIGVISNATGPSAEGVYFQFGFWCSGDTDSMSPSGTPLLDFVSKTGMTLSQYEMWFTDFCTGGVPLDFAAGKMLFLLYGRDPTDPSDTYGQDIGVTGIEIEWTRG